MPYFVGPTLVSNYLFPNFHFYTAQEDPVKSTKEKFAANKDILNEITAVENGLNEGKSAKELVKQFGMACPMPGSFQSSLVSIIGAKSYPDAIRETVLCGGDSCSRYVKTTVLFQKLL